MAVVALINPNLLVQRSDPFTTGIVYMPIGLAYVAAALRAAGHQPVVIDAFGARPRAARRSGAFMTLGLSPSEVIERVPSDAVAVFVFANQLVNHDAVRALLRALAAQRPSRPRIVLENTQAVTAYSLKSVRDDLFEAGATALLSGEAEASAATLVDWLAVEGDLDGLALPGLASPEGDRPANVVTTDLDLLPPPAWDLIPLQGYWDLRFAHGPQTASRYLPLLTSRGCPYPCRFCVVPATNARRWRARSPRSVVDEIELHARVWGVREFHLEDLNPTVRDDRTRAICHELLARRVDVTWKLVSGTKVETIKSEETLELMAAAGCRYVSISPESGSERVLRLMNKSFDREHALRLIRRMNQLNIRTQACFVLGFPGEEEADREETRAMVRELVLAGLDEIALFIVAPVPGSEIFDQFDGYESLSELSFSPAWRQDYQELRRFRTRLYAEFLATKARRHPRKILRQATNFFRRRFETKMEMAPYRALCWKALDVAPALLSGG